MDTNPTSPLLLAALSVFQAALASGAPWGRAAYGGQHPRRLPARLRATSAVACLVYAAGAAALVSSRTSPSTRRLLLRGCVALGALGAVANAVSRSPVERLWTLWSLALGAASLRELRRRRGMQQQGASEHQQGR